MKFRKVIGVLLFLVFFISSVCYATVGNKEFSKEPLEKNNQSSIGDKTFTKVFLDKNEKASNNYLKLIHSFGGNETDVVSTYPDFYGGAYINNDGDLVVNVTEDTLDKSQDIKKRIGSDEFILKSCKHSYKELVKIMNKLNDYKLKNKDELISSNFKSYALLDDQNRIVVYLDNYNYQQMEAFKKQVIDSSAIEFRKANGEFRNYTNLNPGFGLIFSELGPDHGGSIGYRAMKNGVPGIVTAAHIGYLNSYLGIDGGGGSVVGLCTAYKNSGSVDAAFYQIINSNYTPTNTLEGTSNTLSTTISEPGVGTVINKIGKATGQTSGTITSTNVSITVEDIDGNKVLFTNLTQADIKGDHGDSGGIVYSYISSTNTRLTLGIIKGGVEGTTTCYFTKANQINSALGISRY